MGGVDEFLAAERAAGDGRVRSGCAGQPESGRGQGQSRNPGGRRERASWQQSQMEAPAGDEQVAGVGRRQAELAQSVRIPNRGKMRY
ncbi:MAG TPA: hypothetical protein VLY63_04290 [Anaerolineae bacterium]|nr:hypothetical protein [Anaerolineae bacterium]